MIDLTALLHVVPVNVVDSLVIAVQCDELQIMITGVKTLLLESVGALRIF